MDIMLIIKCKISNEIDPEDTKHILTTTNVYCINIYENHLMIKMIDKEITGSLMYILRYIILPDKK